MTHSVSDFNTAVFKLSHIPESLNKGISNDSIYLFFCFILTTFNSEDKLMYKIPGIFVTLEKKEKTYSKNALCEKLVHETVTLNRERIDLYS